MRIVAGKFRSRMLIAPLGNNTRPSSDKTRESIFNIIAPYIYDANVLDLFAGSGALGIEAISRGAKKALFIDNNAIAIDAINSNINNLKIDDICEVIQNDYTYLKNITNQKFDIILFDPPYKLDVFEEILSIIEENSLLSDNGVIVYESDELHSLKKQYCNYTLKVKKYGICYVNILFKN